MMAENLMLKQKSWIAEPDNTASGDIDLKAELYKVQKVQFKFSSRHWTQQSTQVQFIRQKLNLNCCPTHHWTFLNWVQSQFRESGVPPTKKGEELQNFVCHDMEKAQFLLFSTRGHSTLSELTLNLVQKSSMVSWKLQLSSQLPNCSGIYPFYGRVKSYIQSQRRQSHWNILKHILLSEGSALMLDSLLFYWRPNF